VRARAGAAAAVLAAAGLAGAGLAPGCRSRDLGGETARVSTLESRLTLGADDGGSRTRFDRRESPDVTYRVTLAEAPLDAELDLDCDWIDPGGRTVNKNHYRTRRIDKPIWPTHCHHLLGPAAAAGTWRVQMSVAGRVLCSTAFDLE
jgi:hypothetical protein